MKLLFDENLASRLIHDLRDCFPGSEHVRDIGLQSAEDREIWDYAIRTGCAIVTKDADFRQRSFVLGHPPKVIWIRMGNGSTSRVAALLRKRKDEIERFGNGEEQAFLGLG